MRISRTFLVSSPLLVLLALGAIPRPAGAGTLAAATITKTAATHPLEPLSAAETQQTLATILSSFQATADLPKQDLRFPLVSLLEPPKSFVLAWHQGQAIPRAAQVQILHFPSNRTWVATVDLQKKTLLSLELQPLGTQPAVTSGEFSDADAIVHAYEPFRTAMRARGLNPDLVYVDIWAPGDEPLPEKTAAALPFGQKTRLLRCLAFYRGAPVAKQNPKQPQNPYARPIEGIVITVDMNGRKVVDFTDATTQAVIAETGNAPSSTLLKPIISKGKGPSAIQLKGHLVRWHNWQFYAVLHPREGIVLYDVRFNDGGKWRPIAYRLSLSEIFVPYGIGDKTWTWRNAFDVGEYNAGMLAQQLMANRDVPATAQFIDSTFASDLGPSKDNPSGTVPMPATLALYERDNGILWSRTDPTTYDRDTRYARELVATWNTWIGNYIYSFDWIFKLDGSIGVRTILTGTTLNRGTDAKAEASAPKVGIDRRGVLVAAPFHQHFLNFRLDLDVDGPSNGAMEMEVIPQPNSPFGNSFVTQSTHLGQEGYRDLNPFTARHWHVESATSTNPYGKPTSYAIEADEMAFPYAAPSYTPLQKAAFAQHQFWITRYHPEELYAAGTFPNQAKPGDGVTKYISNKESLHGEDLVVWYTTGFTHLSRPEDYPVMPSESIGFKMVPRGFFSKNPALGVSDQGSN